MALLNSMLRRETTYCTGLQHTLPDQQVLRYKLHNPRLSKAKYNELLKLNYLLFTLDLVKEKVARAYKMNDEIKKAEEIGSIMEKSRLTGRRTGISSSDELIDKSEELTDIEELSVDDEVENSQKHDN